MAIGLIVGDSFSASKFNWSSEMEVSTVSVDAAAGNQIVVHIQPGFTASLAGKLPGTSFVVIQGGVNDIRVDRALATIQSAVTSMVTEAQTDGLDVYIMNVAPWKNYAGSSPWTTARQTVTDQYNDWLDAQASVQGFTVIDIYSLLEGDPDELAPAYDFGDGLHPAKRYGTNAIATLAENVINGSTVQAAVKAPVTTTVRETNNFTADFSTFNSSLAQTATDPLGGTDAWSWNEGAATGTSHFTRRAYTPTPGLQYKKSVTVKASNRSWFCIDLQNTGFPANARIFADVTNGVLGPDGIRDGVDFASIEDLGGGFYRVSMAATADSASAGFNTLYIAEAVNDFTFDGLSQESLILYEPKLELVTYPVGNITRGITRGITRDLVRGVTSKRTA